MLKQLADEVGSSLDGITYTTGRYRIQKQSVHPQAATAAADYVTALTSSTTSYHVIGKMPKAGRFLGGVVRAHAIGKASSTIDIGYAASGTAVTSMTTLCTQVAGDGLTANTDFKLTVTTANANVPAGAVIVIKVVTQGTETLTPPAVDLEFQL